MKEVVKPLTRGFQLRINRKGNLCQETEIAWSRANLAEDGQDSDAAGTWRIPSRRKEETQDFKHIN